MDYSIEVDEFGVPVEAFGNRVPSEFFGLLGRIMAVNGKIEYLNDRLMHLPAEETADVRKVAQFLARVQAGRADRNAVVHSYWTLGTHDDPETFVGVRYKTRKLTSGLVAEVALTDDPEDSCRPQDLVSHSLGSLRSLLRRDVATMQIGQLAYREIMLRWAAEQPSADAGR